MLGGAQTRLNLWEAASRKQLNKILLLWYICFKTRLSTKRKKGGFRCVCFASIICWHTRKRLVIILRVIYLLVSIRKFKSIIFCIYISIHIKVRLNPRPGKVNLPISPQSHLITFVIYRQFQKFYIIRFGDYFRQASCGWFLYCWLKTRLVIQKFSIEWNQFIDAIIWLTLFYREAIYVKYKGDQHTNWCIIEFLQSWPRNQIRALKIEFMKSLL